MDLRDADILRALTVSCRTPIRAIASALDISVAAVHKRMISLEESGVVEHYRCLLHPALLGGHAVEVHGRCEVPTTVARCDVLGEHPAVFQVLMASHDHVYVTCVLRSPDELASVLDAAAEALGLREPLVHRYELGPPPNHELTPLDFAICHSLAYRARRPISDIARRLGASDKAVARRIQLLTETDSLVFTIDLGTLDAQWTQIELQTRDHASPEAVLQEAAGCGSSRIIWVTHFADAPGRVHAWVWSPSAGETQRFREALLSQASVVSALPAVLLASRAYPVWIHDEIERRSQRFGPRG